MAVRMPFGKHKNKPIDEIDPTYLEWVLANCQQISPDLKRAICTQLGLEVKDDPKDRKIAELHASIQELRQRMLVSNLEAYDQGYEDGKSGGQANCIRDNVREWHRSLAQEYQGSTEAMTAVNDAYDRLDVIRNKGYNSRMMTYATLQSDRREFLALTGLTLQKFQLLLNAFTPAYERRYPKDRTLADRPRQRCAGGGRKGVLDSPEQKLLFLLVYLKTYPLQVLMGELFGLSQPGVNYWIHRLLPVLRDALDSLSVLPERNPNDFARSQTATGTEPRLIIDGTERRRQRPKSPEKQALHYSGKKKAHTDKNVVIVDLRRKCIGFLSRTYVGKTHDKKIADSEGISYPPKAELYKDTGFQGYEPAVTRTCQAKKKPPRGELTAAEKRTNRKLARIRVNVEHALAGVKRSRIVKDVLRNTKDGVSDSAMEAACGLHNLRVQNRKRPLRR